MRVLVATSTYPLRPDDGSPRFVQDLAEALSERCEVTVLAPGAPGAPRSERRGHVDVRRFTYFLPSGLQRLAYGRGITGNLRHSWWARLQPASFLAAEARAIRRLVGEGGFDVVNSHWIVPQGLAAAWARGTGGRFGHVVTLHGGDAFLLRSLPFARRWARFILARSDAVLAVSNNVRADLDAALGADSGATLQPMGVSVERFRSAEPHREPGFPDGALLFVGRLLDIKGVSVLLRALPRVRERYPGLGLCIVGYGERESALREEAAALGLSEAVRFTGALPHDEVARRLRGCRGLVVPSIRRADGRAEGMPTIVSEALAAGAPIVATETGGIPDVLRDGDNAWLCRDGDPDALAAAILSALAEPAGSARPERARAAADALDWSQVADRYLETFAEVSEARGRRGEPRAGG